MSRRWVPRAIGLPVLLVMGAVYLQARPEQAPACGAARAGRDDGGPRPSEPLLRQLS